MMRINFLCVLLCVYFYGTKIVSKGVLLFYNLVKERLSLPKSPHKGGLSSIVVQVCCSLVMLSNRTCCPLLTFVFGIPASYCLSYIFI